jgi:hypothetical protein
MDGERSVVGLVHNARRGDLRPLLRYVGPTVSRANLPRFPWPRLFSAAAYAAARCEESQLPWSRTASIPDRRRVAAAFVSGLPPGSLHPFGPRAALQSDVIRLCRKWPMASLPPTAPKVLPQIPTLIITSVDDVLAPVSSARAVANLIPGSRLLRLRGAGHDVFGEYGSNSGCATGILEEFLAGARPTDVCGPEWKSYRGASKPPPLSLAELDPDPRVGGRVGRMLRAVHATLREGGEMLTGEFLGRIYALRSIPRRKWRSLLLSPARAGALRRGSYALRPVTWRMTLHGASYVPGVRLRGWIVLAQNPAKRRGRVRVEGPAGAGGTLTIRGGMVTGRLGGRTVSVPTRLGPDVGFIVRTSRAAAGTASPW